MSQPTVLITGANRGIGRELVDIYLKKGYKVVAAVRNVSKMDRLDGVMVVKLEATSETDAKTAVEELKTKYGITHLEIVYASAGIDPSPEILRDIAISELDLAWKVNVLGQVKLWQAVFPLLDTTSKFVFISSTMGSSGLPIPEKQGAYGITKASINFIARKLFVEHPDMIILSISPGWVETGMGNTGARLRGMDKAPEDMKMTIPAMVGLVEKAGLESSGKFLNYDGSALPY